MVRVRFAPSPTGLLHIGNARTAYFNWLYARHSKGQFILRIEDTDIQRSEPQYIKQIIEDLHWLSIDWDEGPDIGGPYGPYLQSHRRHIYKEFCQKLLDNGMAYRCYCSAEELEARRKIARAAGKPPRYDNRCRELSEKEKRRFEIERPAFSVRFKVTDETIVINDIIRGRCEFDMSLVGDFVILKADGTPSFHFAVTVDDALMKITHVIRGEDHLSNTTCHATLFRAIGYDCPNFAHLSLIKGTDGSLLSKRHGSVSISEYKSLGYLPEAITNYISLLGWAPARYSLSKEKIEKFSTKDVIDLFELKDMNKAPAIFDQQKLDWLAGQYFREADIELLTEMACSFFDKTDIRDEDGERVGRERIKAIVTAIREETSCISQVVEKACMFFEEKGLNEEASEMLRKEDAQLVLRALLKRLEGVPEPSNGKYKEIIEAVKRDTQKAGKALYLPLRLALTGIDKGPELYIVMSILGPAKCAQRIKRHIII